mgnify:CR=1 FL=1
MATLNISELNTFTCVTAGKLPFTWLHNSSLPRFMRVSVPDWWLAFIWVGLSNLITLALLGALIIFLSYFFNVRKLDNLIRFLMKLLFKFMFIKVQSKCD